MKVDLLLFLLTISGIVIGQTENHKLIPGTKCSLIPPNGFVASSSFSGFQNNKLGASIMVTEMPGSFQTISEGFTSDALKTRGMTLIDKQTLDHNNSKAILIQVSQQANGATFLKQILIFGDSKKSVMVNGIYPEVNKYIETEIRKSLLSTSYNENQNDNALDAVKFEIDVGGTDFKLAKYMAGSLIYTTDGLIPTEKPSLIVGNSIAKISTENQKQYSIDRLKKLPRGESIAVVDINPIQIDNLRGYEIVGSGKSKDSKDELTYQVMLFDSTGDYFIIIGKAVEDLDNNLKRFKMITKTFKRK